MNLKPHTQNAEGDSNPDNASPHLVFSKDRLPAMGFGHLFGETAPDEVAHALDRAPRFTGRVGPSSAASGGLTVMCSGSKEGSHLRLIESCITQH